MQKLTANKAKTRFGEMLMKVQREPIEIEKNGEPVAVIMSCENYKELEALKLEMLRNSFATARQEAENGTLSDGETFFRELESGQHD